MIEARRQHYITVYKCLAGWKAVEISCNPEGFEEPWQTGYQAFATREEAELDAKGWASAEGIEYAPAPVLMDIPGQFHI